MASGNLLTLLINDGKQDKLLFAVELLVERIESYTKQQSARRQAMMASGQPMSKSDTDDYPPLSFINETHIIPVQGYFKPVVLFGMSYDNVSASHVSWGSKSQYQIYVSADFSHDGALHFMCDSVACPAGVFPALPEATLETIDITRSILTTYRYCDSAGLTRTAGSAHTDGLRWCDGPGMRLIKNLRHSVNTSELDSFDWFTYLCTQKFLTPTDRLPAFNRCIGHPAPVKSKSSVEMVSGVDGATFNALSVGEVLVGPQVPATVQPPLEMWIPVITWSGRDPRMSIPVASLPSSTRILEIELERYEKLIYRVPLNLYLETTVSDIVVNGGVVVNSHTTITRTEQLSTGAGAIPMPNIREMTLYTNSILVEQTIHDIYMDRIGFMIVYTHLSQSDPVSDDRANILLSGLKWPIVYLLAGLRPNVNDDDPEDWATFAQVSHTDYHEKRVIRNPLVGAVVATDTPYMTTIIETNQKRFRPRVQLIQTPQIRISTSVYAHEISSRFYTDYMQYIRGCGFNTSGSDDLLFISFSLRPSSYEPLGHINLSRSRESYFRFTCPLVSPQNRATFFIYACAINFALIATGSISLRYTN
jgi:hypothetical protein